MTTLEIILICVLVYILIGIVLTAIDDLITRKELLGTVFGWPFFILYIFVIKPIRKRKQHQDYAY